MKLNVFFTILIISLVLSGCGSDQATNKDQPTDVNPSQEAVDTSPEPTTEEPGIPDVNEEVNFSDLEQIDQDLNDFNW